jgi:serine phosphatase RsbU (regulator of sigma subunit)
LSSQPELGIHSPEPRAWQSNLWWRMPLIGTVLAIPLAGPASLFLAVYGSGTYADFWTLFLGSLFFTVVSVPLCAVLVAVPFDLRVIQRHALKARQIALARCLTYALLGSVDGYLIYLIITNWVLKAPPPDSLLPALLFWFPLGGAIIGLAYTLLEQYVEQMYTSARLAQELAVARAIQQDLFPKQFPDVAGLTFAAHCTPAHETGGDFYDLIKLESGRVGVVVADVAGKSIAAALLMANARSIWRAAAATGATPKAVLQQTNCALCQDIGSFAFVTLFYAVIDPTEPGVRFAGAGHPPPILCHGSSLRELDANGLPLGLVPDAEYEEAWVSLLPGDSLILYTDGVVESLNARREMFGFGRLHDTLAQLAASPAPVNQPRALIEGVLNAVRHFSGPVEQIDDVTMLAIQVQGLYPEPAMGARRAQGAVHAAGPVGSPQPKGCTP